MKQFAPRITLYAGAALLAGSLAGCAAPAGPSDGAAREVFEERLRDGLSQGTIRINSFQKTSGPVQVPPGDTHVVAFRVELECLKDYTGFYCGRGCKQGTIVRVEEGSGRIQISYDLTNAPTYGLRLSRYEEENKWAGLKFTKTWRGWRADGGKLY